MVNDKSEALKPHKIISEEDVYISKFFKVKKRTIDIEGRQVEKDIVERRPFVLVVPLTENHEVYLVKQYRDALEKVSLEVVAGMLDSGSEDPLDAAKRELREEAGISATDWKKIAQINVSSNMVGTAHVFVAKGLSHGETDFDEDEDLVTVKMPLEEAVEKIATGEIDVGSNIAALLLVNKLYSENKL